MRRAKASKRLMFVGFSRLAFADKFVLYACEITHHNCRGSLSGNGLRYVNVAQPAGSQVWFRGGQPAEAKRRRGLIVLGADGQSWPSNIN